MRLFILAMTVVMGLGPNAVQAAPNPHLPEPTMAETIEHFQTASGLNKDALEVIFDHDSNALGKAQEFLMAAQVLNQLVNAQDSEAVYTLIGAAWDKIQGKLLGKLLSESAQGLVAAIKLYWDTLQVMRDYVVVPALDARVFEAYKQRRDQPGKAYLPKEAFDELAYGTFGNWTGVTYFALREKMMKDFIKVKGINEEVAGDRYMEHLKSQLDDYWMKRLESDYQRYVFQRDWPKIRAKLEAEGENIAQRLRRSTDEIAEKALLKFPQDLPGHAWVQQDCKSGKPKRGALQKSCKKVQGCQQRVKFTDKNPADICRFRQQIGFEFYLIWHRVECTHQVYYEGWPSPYFKDKVSVAGVVLPGRIYTDDDTSHETVFVHYRGFGVEMHCMAKKLDAMSKGDSHVSSLSHKAVKYFIRKALPLIDKLYDDGAIPE